MQDARLLHELLLAQAPISEQQQLPMHLPQLSVAIAEQLEGIEPQGRPLSPPPQPQLVTSAAQVPRHNNPRKTRA